MNRKLLVVSFLTVAGCSDRSADISCDCAPSFASVELPVSGGGEDPAQQLWIEITDGGATTLNGVAVGSPAELLAGVTDAARQNPNPRAFISADDGVTYGTLMIVIDRLKQAGISRMAFDVPPRAAL